VAPERTKSRFVPSDSILAVIVDWAPLPIDISDITAATPIMIPSTVSEERILFAAIALKDVFTVSMMFMA
jgi:hypothetical protein